MKVLIVDDEIFNIKVASGYIKLYFPEFIILECTDPKHVMNILETENVDIILLDIMMPGIDGMEVLREIRSHDEYKELQILMLTALTDDDSFKISFELGANDYIKKPIDTTEFQARIKEAGNSRRNSSVLHEMYSRMKDQNQELKVVNQALKDTQFHLIQSEKMAAIGELAAGVAHEINNPIGYIASNLETMSNYLKKMKEFIQFGLNQVQILQDDSQIKDPKFLNMIMEEYKKRKIKFVSEDLDAIIKDSKDGIDKVAEIVKSLRNFSRTGEEEEKNFYPLDEIIRQVLLITRNEAKYSVEISWNDQESLEVYCNKLQLGQVLLNIIINAIQAIKAQNRSKLGKIWIETKRKKEAILIKISDDGPGILESNLAKIFDPFFTTKDVGQGTGLGLSISYDIIVKKHKGKLDVKSKPGQGTMFIIELPDPQLTESTDGVET